MSTLAERLKTARTQARLSQKQLEDRSGVSQKTVSKLERGDQANSTQIVQLARACRVRAEWLATGEPPMVDQGAITAAESRATYNALSTDALEIARMWQDLPDDRRDHHRASIALESVMHELVGARSLWPKSKEFRNDYQKRFLRVLRGAIKGSEQ